MGPFVPHSACAKGPLFHYLDDMSKRPNARELLKALARALEDKVSGGFPELEKTLDHYLFTPLGVPAAQIAAISNYFTSRWLDAASPDVYFREMQPIAPIIGMGLLKTLEYP